MFLAFVIAVTFLAFNVLVGLTVDDIRNFLGNADLRKLSMRLEFIRQMEQVKHSKLYLSWFAERTDSSLQHFSTITKNTPYEAKIFKEIEKRQMEIRKEGKMEVELKKLQAKMEHQQSKIKELKEMHVHTNNLMADIKASLQQLSTKQ